MWFAVLSVGCTKQPVPGNISNGGQRIASDDGELDRSISCAAPVPRRPITELSTREWIVALRSGPVSELTEAGQEAAPILIEAMQDPLAAGQILQMLRFSAHREEWLIPVLAAGLKNP